MDLPHRKEKRSFRLFPELTEASRTGNKKEDQVPMVGWWKGVFFRPSQQLSAIDGNSARNQLQIYAEAKQRCREDPSLHANREAEPSGFWTGRS